MAACKDYDNISQQVHIPPCDNRECSDKLVLLVNKLAEAGVTCEHKYKPNGLYKRWFEEFTRTCSFTILHICSHFWKKLSKIQTTSDLQSIELSDKIMCIKFDNYGGATCQPEEENRSNKVECQMFFEHFTPRDITKEAGLIEFVQEVLMVLHDRPGVDILKPDNEPKIETEPRVIHRQMTNSLTDDDNKLLGGLYEQWYGTYHKKSDDDVLEMLVQLELCEANTKRENKETMTIFPDKLGQTSGQDVHVRTEHLQAVHWKLISFSSLKSFQHLRIRLDSLNDEPLETILATQCFLLKKVIPELYNCKNMFALAHVALCNQAVLQAEAILVLELLLLEGQVENTNLRKTERLLSESLENTSPRYSSSKSDKPSLHIQRLSNLLLRLNYEVAIHCPADKDHQAKEDKKFRFNFVSKKRTSENMSSTEGTLRKTPKQLKKIVNEFCESVTEENQYATAMKLITRRKPVQIIVIHEFLKKIFSTMTVEVIMLLREYVGSNKSASECVTMIIHALALFLSHGLRTAHNKDIQEVCATVMNVLYAIKGKDLSNEAKHMLYTLVFDKTPVIRQGMILYMQERSVNTDEFEQLLVAEISRLLSPLLILNNKKSIYSEKTTWLSAYGTFSHIPVVVLFHKPKMRDHWGKNEAYFINFADTMHTNQVHKLLMLQHENIITLFAYQMSCIPQFYVLDDYTNNLQIALKNRNDNRQYFDQPTLMKALVSALEALDYCHSKGIVHRNLTAGALFIVGDRQVKLGGFHLAIDLDGQEEVTFMKGSSQIPTRWSAPESLCKLMYSKASDVCMFGHVMYEFFTHGALPYSHLTLSHLNFVQMVTTKQIQLCQEVCIKKEVNDVIRTCVAYETKDRPDTATLKELLSNLTNGISAAYKPRYPSLSDTPSGNMRQPSTSFDKGTPEYEDLPSEMANIESIYITSADGIKQYQMGKGYLFREIVIRKISQQMQDQLSSATKDIIPSCTHFILEVSEDKHIFEYYIPSLFVSNFRKCISNRELGEDLCSYLNVLKQIAEILERLHKASFVLGDISMSSVFLEFEDNVPKPNIVSWAYLNCIQTFSDETHLNLPQKTSVLKRAAPEVQKSGLYSPASDVYCFGQFLVDFCEEFQGNITDEANPYVEATVTPYPRCFSKLMEIADQCRTFDKRQSLTMSTLIYRINSLHEQAKLEFEDQADRTDSTIPKRPLSFSSDNNCQVIPKTLFEKRNSFDSAFDESNSESRSLHQVDVLSEEMLIYEPFDSMPQYCDGTSSPAHITPTLNYVNLPMPKIAAKTDLEPIYTEPTEVHTGYRYLKSRACLNKENTDLYKAERKGYSFLNKRVSFHIYEALNQGRNSDNESNRTPFPGLNTGTSEDTCQQSVSPNRRISCMDAISTSTQDHSIAPTLLPRKKVDDSIAPTLFPRKKVDDSIAPTLLPRKKVDDYIAPTLLPRKKLDDSIAPTLVPRKKVGDFLAPTLPPRKKEIHHLSDSSGLPAAPQFSLAKKSDDDNHDDGNYTDETYFL